MEPVQGWEAESLVLRMTTRSSDCRGPLSLGKPFLGIQKNYLVGACLAEPFIT